MSAVGALIGRILRRTRRLPAHVGNRLAVRAFRREVLGGPPLAVDRTGDVQVRTFFGRTSILEGVAALKSFYRFAPRRYPLFVHEDGSLTRDDAVFLERHFPGVRVVDRVTADREVVAYLKQQGLEKCAGLRQSFILSLKFFDLPFYGLGKRLLYMDSDVLFLQRPTALIEALETADSGWQDRFALDIHTYYSWSIEAIEQALRIRILPLVNSGLLALRRTSLDWSLAETCLSIRQLPDSAHYREQSLFAVDLSRSGAVALPADYDVCFRHTWRDHYDTWLLKAASGHEVVSQHYCGSPRQRSHFYRHFVKFVAPELLPGPSSAKRGIVRS